MSDPAPSPPIDPDIINRLAQAERAALARHFGEALGICGDVLASFPGLAVAHATRGAILAHSGALTEAAAALETAVRLDPGQPGWHGNLAGVNRLLCRLDDAVAGAREAVRLAPHEASTWLNLGKILDDLDERDEAIDCFIKTLQREPENAEGHLGIGQMLLAEGNYRAGWVEYEWRNRLDHAKNTLPRMTTAEWNGMAMPNDCILLIADQGFGDSIHFSRFIPLAAARVGRVVLACSPEMERLLAQVEGVGGVYSRWEAIPPHAMHCLLSSLPRVLGTEVETIPAAIPYLTPDAGLRTAWNERLRTCVPSGGKPLVGVVWAGRAVHPNDKRRSLRLETLAPLTGLPGIQIISLQKPVPEQDRDHFAALGLHDWSDALTDFSETLALLSMLDLVVSVDSAVAHLTGAAGVRVWTLLPNPADWRWMKGRRDTPWYPSMRLFRQGQAGDWVPVIRAVAREAEELFGTCLDPVAEQRLERDPPAEFH